MRALSRLCAFCGALALFAAALPAAAGAASIFSDYGPKTSFFATSAACVASRAYSKRECDNAFSNALLQIAAHRLAFGNRIDCILRFHLCERRGAASPSGRDELFAPVVLGVEIERTKRGSVSAPVFAAPTPPGLMTPQSIETAYAPSAPRAANRLEPAQRPFDQSRNLATDHFALVDPNLVRQKLGPFYAPRCGSSGRFRR